MSKRSHKALASATVMSLILTSTLTATNVQAAAEVTRTGGADRLTTAQEVAKQVFGKADTVVLVNGYGYADAVSATPLAKALNAPILLTSDAEKPSSDLVATLASLGAKKVVIVGGTGVVKDSLKDELAKTYTVERIAGSSRYETNANVAKEVLKLTKATKGVLVSAAGYADALSVASIAAAKGMPVLFGNAAEVPAEVKEAAKGLELVAVGGTGVLPDSVLASVKATRVANGADRFDTNLKVLEYFKGDLKDVNNIFMAAGGRAGDRAFADALVASAAAAKYGAPVVLTGLGASQAQKDAAAKYVADNKKADMKVTIVGGTGSVDENTFNAIKNIVNPVTGELAVDSVKAASANSFKVTFNKAVEDTSKVTFEVKRSTTPVTVTANWNEAKTEATLVASANLTEGSYTVAVKNDSKEIKTETIAITQQKVAKIDITSTKLSVYRDKDGKETGYVTYKVYDQYNNDITSSYLANNINFQTGVGDITKKDGVITITPKNIGSLIQFANVVVTGYDTTSGVSVTATLATSTVVGTLSDFKLGELKETLTLGDNSKVYYIPFTAYDMSGNETKNFDLVYKGLILTDDKLSVTNPNILEAKVVHDPANAKNAAIEVRVKADLNQNYIVDMPITIMAMTYTGKNSSISTTVKKANRVDKFTMMAPSATIAEGDTNIEIPFEAYDQAGNKVTKVNDLKPYIVFNEPTRLEFQEKADGSAKLVLKTVATAKSTMFLTSTVQNTPNMSQLTLNIQDKAVADTLELDSSVLVNAMENGATQKIDLGADAGGLKIKDQYGREIDMVTIADANPNSGCTVAIETTGDITSDKTQLAKGNSVSKLTANAANGGSGTVTFTLKDKAGNVRDTKSVSLSVVKSDDIKGYSVNEVKDAIYANTTAVGSLNDREKAYAATLKVYGKTASGSKVLLAGTPVIGVSVDNTADFIGTTTNAGIAYDGGKVAAGKIADTAKTGSSTNAHVNILHNGSLSTETTTIKSSTEAVKATDIGFEVDNFDSLDKVVATASGDEVTITDLAGANFKQNAYMTKYDNENKKVTDDNLCKVIFFAKDQYGKKAMKLSQYRVVSVNDDTTVAKDAKLAIDNNGMFTKVDLKSGDKAVISAVTNTGLVKTILVRIQ